MSTAPKPGKARAKAPEMTILARVTHPLVFFSATFVVYEGTIATALVTGKHSDTTVIILCSLMALVIITASILVTILVIKKPRHLMLTQQDTIGDDIKATERVTQATRLLLERPKPKTPTELLTLMEEVKVTLSGEPE